MQGFAKLLFLPKNVEIKNFLEDNMPQTAPKKEEYPIFQLNGRNAIDEIRNLKGNENKPHLISDVKIKDFIANIINYINQLGNINGVIMTTKNQQSMLLNHGWVDYTNGVIVLSINHTPCVINYGYENPKIHNRRWVKIQSSDIVISFLKVILL